MTIRNAVLGFLLLGGLAAPGLAMAAPADNATPEVIAPPDMPAITAERVPAPPPTNVSAAVAAPMPDADADAPVVATDDAPRVQPAFYGHKTQFRGDGFGDGSTAQSVQDRSLKPAAGLALNVPLD